MNVNALNGTSFAGKNKLASKKSLMRQRTVKKAVYNQARRTAKAEGKKSFKAAIVTNQAENEAKIKTVTATNQATIETIKTNGNQIIETIKKSCNKKTIGYFVEIAAAAVLTGSSIYLHNKNKNNNSIA